MQATHPSHAVNTVVQLLTGLRSREASEAIVRLETLQAPIHRSVLHASDLLDLTRQFAIAFAKLTVGPGTSIAFATPPSGATVAAMLGAIQSATVFPINPMLSSEAMTTQFARARVTLLVIDSSDAGIDLSQAARAAVAKRGDITIVDLADAPARGCVSWRRLAKDAQAQRQPPDLRNAADTAMLFHSGGTSGDPKLVELSEASILAAAAMFAAATRITPQDRMLLAMPLFHVAGLIDGVLGVLMAGGAVVFPTAASARHPDFARKAWDACRAADATLLAVAPPSLQAIHVAAEGDPPNCLRAILTGSTAISPQLVSAVQKAAGVPVCQIYGMTEASGMISGQPANGEYHPPGVGRAAPGCAIKIEGASLDRAGEVMVRGANIATCYRTGAGPISLTDGEGWLATGDLGHFAADGQLVLTGRSKDVIIRSGHNIDPSLIEERALLHPDVIEAAAVGMPDAYAGEVPAVFVTTRGSIDCDALRVFIADGIADRPASPRMVLALPAMPLTAIGKLHRNALRRLATEHVVAAALADLGVAYMVEDKAPRHIRLGVNPASVSREARRRIEAIGLTIDEISVSDSG